jgi:excisionase family DNA binding protein
MDQTHKWMSSDEAAAYLGVIPATLRRLINDGQLVGYRIGRVIRVQRTDIDAFLEEARIRPVREAEAGTPPD